MIKGQYRLAIDDLLLVLLGRKWCIEIKGPGLHKICFDLRGPVFVFLDVYTVVIH